MIEYFFYIKYGTNYLLLFIFIDLNFKDISFMIFRFRINPPFQFNFLNLFVYLSIEKLDCFLK